MVWLRSYRRLGCFPRLEAVPETVVEHVRTALKLPAGVVARVDDVPVGLRVDLR